MPDYKEEVAPKFRPIKENFPDIYDQTIISDSIRAGKRLLWLKDGRIAIYDYVDRTMTIYKADDIRKGTWRKDDREWKR